MPSLANDAFIQFPPLRAVAAFRVLESLADAVDELEDAQVRLVAESGGGRFLAPDPNVQGRKGRDRHFKTIERLHEAIVEHSGTSGVTPRRVNRNLEELPLLGVGVTEVLIADTERLSEAESPIRREEHYLVAAYGEPESEILALVEQIQQRATGLRFAVATYEEPQLEAVLLKVLDDPDRGASVQSLMCSGRFPRVAWLNAYPHERGTVYLSKELRPNEESLAGFGRLSATLPRLFGIASEHTGTEVELAVMVGRQPAERETAHLIPLNGLFFRPRADAIPHAAPRPSVTLLPLKNGGRLVKQLHRVVLSAEQQRGYRLSLQNLPPTACGDREVEQIEQQIRDLEDRRLYLESTREPQWILMRFLPHQIDAMAEALRSFDIEELESGKIRYAFEPIGGAGEEEAMLGQHFLLFEPAQSPMRWPFAEFSWRRSDPPIRFWMDPYWNLEYGRSNRSKVMVPLDHALHPPLHSWHRSDMDAYLREIVTPWFSTVLDLQRGAARDRQGSSQALPENPIYLFDSAPEGRERDLKLQVLDADSFVPVRDRLGFINQNIILMDNASSIGGLVESLAEDASRRQLARAFAAGAQAAEDETKKAAEELNKEVAKEFGTLLDVVRVEFEMSVKELQKSEKALKALHAEVRATAAVLSGAKKEQKAIEEELSALGEKAKTFWKEKKDIEAKVGEAVQEANDLIGSTEHKIRRVHEQLQATIDRLERKIRGGGYW